MFSDLKNRVKKVGQAPGTPVYTGENTTKETIIFSQEEMAVNPAKRRDRWIDLAVKMSIYRVFLQQFPLNK